MGRRPCCSKEGLNRGAWTAMEDKKLADYIATHGEGKWRDLPQKAGLKRCGKSCRLRWLNYLRPGIKRGNITDDEAELIVRLHKLLGNRWSLIAGRLPGRTDNEIKNYWNTNLRKKQHHHHHHHNNKYNTQSPQTSPAADRDDHQPPSKTVATNNITPIDHNNNHDQSRSDSSSSKAIRTKASRCSGKPVFLNGGPTIPSPILMPPTAGSNSDDSNYDGRSGCHYDGVDDTNTNGLLSCDLEIDEELLSELLQSTDFSWLIDDLMINDHQESQEQRHLSQTVVVDTITDDDHAAGGDRIVDDHDDMAFRSLAAATSTELQTSLIVHVAATGSSTDDEGAS